MSRYFLSFSMELVPSPLVASGLLEYRCGCEALRQMGTNPAYKELDKTLKQEKKKVSVESKPYETLNSSQCVQYQL